MMTPNKILIAEDDPAAIDFLSDLFEEHGYQILTALGGQNALQIVSDQQPQIVLMAENLNGTDAFELCRRMKSHMNGVGPKIIMTTAKIDDAGASKAREAGADDYMMKTSSYFELLDAVKRLMNANGKA